MSELVVHSIPDGWGLPSIGPFCLKLETWLRMTEIPYRVVFDATPFRGPKGKLPWIEHEGRKLGDSGFIVDYLKEAFGRDPDADLAPHDRAVALALRRLVEDSLYWTMVYDRWMVEENWNVLRPILLGRVSRAARPVVAPLARRGVRQQLDAQGIGRHSRDEIHAIGIRDVNAIANVLGDRSFLLGDTPSEIDAVAYGLLANIVTPPLRSPVRDAAIGRATLMEWLERMRTRYFP